VVANVMLTAERRGRLMEAQTTRFLELLQQLPITTDDAPTDLAAVMAAGRRHELRSCDASYLILAERLDAPPATLDRRLAEAAESAGVPLNVVRP
jgi:predicted nucleic acid-binding protein